VKSLIGLLGSIGPAFMILTKIMARICPIFIGQDVVVFLSNPTRLQILIRGQDTYIALPMDAVRPWSV